MKINIRPDMPVTDTAGNGFLGFGTVLEHSLNEIYIFDGESLKFVQVNEGARRNLGYAVEELVTMTPVDIKPAYTEGSFRALISTMVDGEKQKIEFNTIHLRKDGSTYLVEVHMQKIQFNNRTMFVAIILDITQRIRTESDLVKARTFFEAAPDATVVVDESGTIQAANRQMIRLFGYGLSELQGMSVDQLVPDRFRKGHADHREQFNANQLTRGMGTDLELSALTKTGQEIPIEVSLSPIEWQGTTLIAAAVRDISTRKATENALIKSEEKLRQAKNLAETATATKTRFLAAASHDLRQPLQALRLYLSALTRNLDQPRSLQLSEKMNLSLDAMTGLLDALLDISMLESGSIQPEKRDVGLLEILDRVVADNHQQAEQKGLLLDCDVIECIVHTDPALLERILENFVSNAIRYTDQGKVSIHCQLIAGAIRIEVSDTGIGISEAEFGSVFEEYYQIDNPDRGRDKGLGLGLSIVKHLSRILDNPVNVSSVIDAGSTFSIDVPLAENQEVVDKVSLTSVPRTESAGQPVILIVDDNPVIVDAMLEIMQTLDLSIITAGSGDEALTQIQTGLRPALVISDLRMPGMSGIDLINKIRAVVGENLPAVIMTGDTAALKMKENRLVNCTMLHKPVDMDQLLSLVESLRT